MLFVLYIILGDLSQPQKCDFFLQVVILRNLDRPMPCNVSTVCKYVSTATSIGYVYVTSLKN